MQAPDVSPRWIRHIGPLLAALLELGCNSRTPGPVEQNTRPVTPAPMPAKADAGLARTNHFMLLHEKLSHGYGCGGHCAFNWRGDSQVQLDFQETGEAKLTDIGRLEQDSSFPDHYTVHLTEWSLAWVGRWSGDAHRRSLQLRSEPSSKVRSRETVGGKAPGSWKQETTLPETLELLCVLEPPPTGRHRAPNAPNASGPSSETKPVSDRAVAWVCRAPKRAGEPEGTKLPWVFSRAGTVERMTMGEPYPESTYTLP